MKKRVCLADGAVYQGHIYRAHVYTTTTSLKPTATLESRLDRYYYL